MSFSNNLFAQCTPDPNLTTSGTFPAALDTAKVGQLYSQVLQYHITKDTTIYVAQLGSTVNAKIDTLWITGVVGMPDGFSYTCHNKDCKIIGGATGCATLTGTPKDGSAGIYPLRVLIQIRATAMFGPLPISQTVNDSNMRYTIIVQGGTGIGEMVENQDVILYPNPAKADLQVYVPTLRENANYSISNLQGQNMINGQIIGNREVSHLNISNLSSGVYFIQIQSANCNLVKKFWVE